jgi:hypothetical protein
MRYINAYSKACGHISTFPHNPSFFLKELRLLFRMKSVVLIEESGVASYQGSKSLRIFGVI